MAGFKIYNGNGGIIGTDGAGISDSSLERLDDGIDFWAFGIDEDGYFWIGWWWLWRWLMLGMY